MRGLPMRAIVGPFRSGSVGGCNRDETPRYTWKVRFTLSTALAALLVTGWLVAAAVTNQTAWWIAGAIVVYIAAVMVRT